MRLVGFFRIAAIILLAVSLFSFLLNFVSSIFSGGCYIDTYLGDVVKPEEMGVEFRPGTCTPGFFLINKEEQLTLYTVKATSEIVQEFCISGESVHNVEMDVIAKEEERSLCKPIQLSLGEEYYFGGYRGKFEIFTDKGTVSGNAIYLDRSELKARVLSIIFETAGIAALIAFALSAVLSHKDKHT